VDDSPPNPSLEIWNALHSLRSARVFPKGARLFQEGLPADRVFFVEDGQVRIFFPVEDPSKEQLPGLAGPGSVLGLSESVSGQPYRVTAEATAPTTVSYVERQQLMEFLRQHCDICMQVVRLLSEDLHGLYHQFRSMDGARPRGRRKSLRNLN
jgi:CRP-like cAMP-binding protein